MSWVESMKAVAADGYYRLARTTALGRLHNQVRRRRHRARYGVDSAFMFKAVELEINSLCNRTCSYCPNATSKRPKGNMSRDLFEKIIGELASMDFDGRVS